MSQPIVSVRPVTLDAPGRGHDLGELVQAATTAFLNGAELPASDLGRVETR